MGGVANQDQTTESGADDAAASNHPHQLILMKPHGRLRCTDRRREVGRDWPEQRCALPVAPTDPSALTRVRLRASAAGHTATSTRRRAVKLATLGASRTSWRTTTEPVARSGSGRDASGSARCEPCHHRGGACVGAPELRATAAHARCVAGLLARSEDAGVGSGTILDHAELRECWIPPMEQRAAC